MAQTMATEPENKVYRIGPFELSNPSLPRLSKPSWWPWQRRPVFLGVVGDSGSGKSTLTHGLNAIFGAENITEICLDDYHAYDRAELARRHLTALHPQANNLRLMYSHLAQLRRGQTIIKPVYDHATGTFAPHEQITPRPIVLVHGLFTLFSPQIAGLFDLGVYLDPDPELRLQWKILRDTTSRGYKLAEVLEQVKEREPDAAAFIAPQKQHAGLVVNFQYCADSKQPALDVRLDWPQDTRLLELTARPCFGRLNAKRGGKLYIDGNIQTDEAYALAENLGQLVPMPTAPLEQLGYYNEQGQMRHSHTLALTQLIVAARLVEKLANSSALAGLSQSANATADALSA